MTSSSRMFRVLLVEPNEDLLLTLRHHLLKSGFEVHSANSGETALAQIKPVQPELLIVDDSLPDMTPVELRRLLFLDPGTRDMPVLFLCGKRNQEILEPVLRVGLDECLCKPCDTLLLVTRAQTIIARRKTQDELTRTDPLTRLLNKTALERQISEDLPRLERYQRFACLALLDVDDLGTLNEAQGVATGDLLLSALASMAAARIRTSDVAGRYGGGQLMLYLPETREKGARILTERLLEHYRLATHGLTGQHVSFCGSLLEAPRDGATWELLCSRGEATMRAAKAVGPGVVASWQLPSADKVPAARA